MKKKKLFKAILVILIPGGIPIWVGYKLYEQIKNRKR